MCELVLFSSFHSTSICTCTFVWHFFFLQMKSGRNFFLSSLLALLLHILTRNLLYVRWLWVYVCVCLRHINIYPAMLFEWCPWWMCGHCMFAVPWQTVPIGDYDMLARAQQNEMTFVHRSKLTITAFFRISLSFSGVIHFFFLHKEWDAHFFHSFTTALFPPYRKRGGCLLRAPEKTQRQRYTFDLFEMRWRRSVRCALNMVHIEHNA